MIISRIRPRTWIGLTIAFVASGIGFIVYSFYITISVTVPNAYAVWVSAELVIQHMEAHKGAWPSGWDDLRPYYIPETTIESPTGFKNLINRVEIDWAVDIDSLKASIASDANGIKVIWLRDGRDDQWQGAEPNELIMRYLSNGYRDPAPGYSNRLDEIRGPVTDLVADTDE